MALFPPVNPIGTAVILLGMTPNGDAKFHRALAKQISINMIVLLTIVLISGRYILKLFGISIPVVQVGGGAVRAAMGWNLLNQPAAPAQDAGDYASAHVKSYWDKAFFPFTFPITVGAGSTAVMLTLSAHTSDSTFEKLIFAQVGTFLGIVGMAILFYLCFANADRIVKRVGPSGIQVMMKLIAFIVVCIGVKISLYAVTKKKKDLEVPEAAAISPSVPHELPPPEDLPPPHAEAGP